MGCGTGRLAGALAERGARVWGVDPSAEMLARARATAGRRVRFKEARAEALPFKAGWFERAVLRLAVHLVDRTRALPELARVLAPGGRVVVATFAPEHFGRYWLSRMIPAVAELDSRRFPAPEALARELADAGFERVEMRRLCQRARISREEALERIAGRFISTLRLLDDETVAAGLARAERELPDAFDSELEWAVVRADRPDAPQ